MIWLSCSYKMTLWHQTDLSIYPTVEVDNLFRLGYEMNVIDGLVL